MHPYWFTIERILTVDDMDDIIDIVDIVDIVAMTTFMAIYDQFRTSSWSEINKSEIEFDLIGDGKPDLRLTQNTGTLLLSFTDIAGPVGDWTTAVSRKERKNRSKRDEASRHDKLKVFAEMAAQKIETPNCSASPGSNNTKKKVCITIVQFKRVIIIGSTRRAQTFSETFFQIR